MKVLVVDDDPAVVRALQRLLESRGDTVCSATTGEGALRLVRSEHDLDVVLLDVELGPGIDGIEVARRVPRGIPLIIVSGYDAATIHARARGGVDALQDR